jgi:hypothetical protein
VRTGCVQPVAWGSGLGVGVGGGAVTSPSGVGAAEADGVGPGVASGGTVGDTDGNGELDSSALGALLAPMSGEAEPWADGDAALVQAPTMIAKLATSARFSVLRLIPEPRGIDRSSDPRSISASLILRLL